MGGFNPRLHPYSQSWNFAADPAGDVTFNVFRMPSQGKVLAVYAVNDAAIATATNTLRLALVSRGTSGTDAASTIANFVSTSTWAADTPRTGALTAANQRITTSGTWLAVEYDETGTGTWTRATVQMDYIVGAYEDSA